MKTSNNMKIGFKLSALASALALAMGPASAAEVWLAAKPVLGGMALPISGGGTENVPMWGYVEDADGTCYNAANDADRLTCVDGLPDPALPGPRLSVPPGDSALTIHLSNGLSVPTSIVMPGQALPVSGGTGPTWDDNSTGPRSGDMGKRVRSYGAEAAADGGAESYAFTLDRTGSYIYHSGTSPQLQVYMGLYGAVTRDAAAGEAYAGVPYDNEVILFYSDVDPVHNNAVDSGDTTYTPIHYNAQWFLVNGEPYAGGMADIPAGNAVTGPGDSRSNTLVRLLSTASETHVPTLQGLYMSIHAEDGFRYEYQNGANFGDYAPREQYSAMLPPLKTKDAIVVAGAEGRYAVYDGNGYMTNPSDPNNFNQGDELGGMLRFLSVGAANQPPVAVDDSGITTPENTPVDINVVSNDSDPNGDALTIVSVTQGAIGSVTISDATCCVLYTPNANASGPDSFDYTITDGNGVTSTATALVNVTVTAVNDPPVAAGESYTTDEDVPLVVAAPGVLGNDSDVDGDTLTAVLQTGPANGGLVLSADGSFTYTPTADYNGSDSFTYVANDGTVDSNLATVNITVTAVNDAPVALDDAYSVDQDTVLNVAASGVLSNDSDVDGPNPLTAALGTGPGNGSVALNADGSFDYTPNTGFFGSDSFTYTAFDGVDNSTPATVTVTVNEVATGPAIQLYFSTLQGGANGSVPDVAGPYNNADIYAYDGVVYSRIVDAGFAGNVNALHVVDADHFYVSFANNGGVTNGGVTFQDEDVAEYNNGTWATYFDGSLCGLDANNGQDIDAISIDGSTLYFSTLGGGNNNPVGGVAAPYDDADVYTWNGGTTGTANCGRALDANVDASLPGNADIDGLTVKAGTYYMSFLGAGTAQTTVVPILGAVNDEAVVSFDGTTWTLYFSGPGLTGNGQDVDAVHVP